MKKTEKVKKNKTKIIATSIGVFVLILVVLISIIGSLSRNTMTMTGGMGYDNSVAGLPSRSMSFNNPLSSGSAEKMAVVDNSLSENYQETESPEIVDKKIIKNGNLTLKVDSVDEAVIAIEKIAKNNSGDIFSSNFSKNNQDQKSGTLSVKVPVANFEKTYSEAKQVAVAVLRESTSGQDVTEQYQDLEGQIKNKQAEEVAYQKVLDQAEKISDIIEVTQALSRVRGNIESLQGRLRYLASQTDMSTIMINLSEDPNITPPSDSWRPIQVVKEAVRSLVVKVQNFIDFLIAFIISVLPVLILYLILFWIIFIIGRAVFRKILKKKEENTIKITNQK
ncbi:MAG: DUF4349 domain-containing protein [Candidatus Moraniibacteriota bacterium]